ncbi:MAG: hypothetical protein EBR88_04445 [Betaproteobacteria bacterium]|nr:hypothetical protein [Betaproteobacteria bacterium]
MKEAPITRQLGALALLIFSIVGVNAVLYHFFGHTGIQWGGGPASFVLVVSWLRLIGAFEH